MKGFHGNIVSVYIKKETASLKDNVWERVVIDDFGPLDPKSHTGTIHNVEVVRIGKNKFDSFVIACMGARKFLPFLYPTRITQDYLCFVAVGKREFSQRPV